MQNTFDHIQSASGLQHGKPHPPVYLATAEKRVFNQKPRLFVAVEK